MNLGLKHAAIVSPEIPGWGFALRHVVQWNRNIVNTHLIVVMSQGARFEFVGEDADRVENHLRAFVSNEAKGDG